MKLINRFEEAFISISIIFATVLVLVNVILRLLGFGLTWSEELIRYVLIWVTFVGMSVCARESSHMSIEFIPQMLRGKAYTFLMGFIYILAVVFSIMLTWYSYLLVDFSIQTGQVTPGVGIPFYIIYLIIPISGGLLVIRYTQLLIKLFTRNNIDNNFN